MIMGNPKKTKTKNAKPLSERYTLTNSIANFFLLAVFAVFPLFVNFTFNGSFPFLHFDAGYIAIRHQKYYFFLVVTAAAVITELLLLITRSSQERKEAAARVQRPALSMTFTDWAVVAFVLACATSTVLSPHIQMAFTGEVTVGSYTHGRNNGLILMLFYAAVYFFLTRCWRFKEYVFIALAAVSGAVSLLAVLNTFYIDPLNMFDMFQNDKVVFNDFITTIGNKNMFSSYLCVTVPVTMTMFVYTQKVWRKVIYLLASVFGAWAVVVCNSDSAVLGMGICAMVMLVAYLRRPQKLKQYLLILTVMLFGVKLLGMFTLFSGWRFKTLDAAAYQIAVSDITFYVVGGLAVLTILVYLLNLKNPDKVLPLAVPIIAGAVCGLAVLAGVGTIVYFTVFNTEADLGGLERTLRYSDAWGTHRGFMWNKSIEAFTQYTPLQKLFGTGPETFYFTFSPYFDELYNRFGDGSTDAAHNEYINYLLNIGIVGLTSYLAFTLGALVRGFKAAKRNPLSLVFASAIVAYMAQAVVNIALPIATPLFIVCISLCETVSRQRDVASNPRNQRV